MQLAAAARGRHRADARGRRGQPRAAVRAAAARWARPARARVRTARERGPPSAGTSSVSVGLVDGPPDDPAGADDRQLQEHEQVQHRPAHEPGWYARQPRLCAKGVIADTPARAQPEGADGLEGDGTSADPITRRNWFTPTVSVSEAAERRARRGRSHQARGVAGAGFVSAGVLRRAALARRPRSSRRSKERREILQRRAHARVPRGRVYAPPIAVRALIDRSSSSADRQAATRLHRRAKALRRGGQEAAFDFGDAVTNQEKFEATPDARGHGRRRLRGQGRRTSFQHGDLPRAPGRGRHSASSASRGEPPHPRGGRAAGRRA